MDFRLRQSRARMMLVDITPMIDVVFLLIVFFLATAQFAKLTREDLDLPLEQGEQLEAQDEPGVIVNVLADGTIRIDDNDVDLDRLREIVASEIAAQPDRDPASVKLYLRADRNLGASRLNEIIRLMQDMGIGLGRFGTEVPR